MEDDQGSLRKVVLTASNQLLSSTEERCCTYPDDLIQFGHGLTALGGGRIPRRPEHDICALSSNGALISRRAPI